MRCWCLNFNCEQAKVSEPCDHDESSLAKRRSESVQGLHKDFGMCCRLAVMAAACPICYSLRFPKSLKVGTLLSWRSSHNPNDVLDKVPALLRTLVGMLTSLVACLTPNLDTHRQGLSRCFPALGCFRSSSKDKDDQRMLDIRREKTYDARSWNLALLNVQALQARCAFASACHRICFMNTANTDCCGANDQAEVRDLCVP